MEQARHLASIIFPQESSPHKLQKIMVTTSLTVEKFTLALLISWEKICITGDPRQILLDMSLEDPLAILGKRTMDTLKMEN